MAEDQHWATHKYQRVYELAARLDNLPGTQAAHGLITEEFGDHHAIVEYLESWQRQSAVHKLVKLVAHRIFYRETGGPYIRIFNMSKPGADFRRQLTVDRCLIDYGLSEDFFEVPKSSGEWVMVKPKRREWREDSTVEDACFKYFTEDLMWSAQYDELLDRLAEEVFHIVFMNRGLLQGLHLTLASYVQDVGLYGHEALSESEHAALFTQRGTIRRIHIPEWVKRAVYFRDRGMCCDCGRDLTGLTDSFPSRSYDHIVPLAAHGLNDVSNIQLLCGDCNRKKAGHNIAASERYRPWF